MGRLTTHVLDTANGCPGAGIEVSLFRLDDERELLTSIATNRDGRTDAPLLDDADWRAGRYELLFAVGRYFSRHAAVTQPPFLDDVVIRFAMAKDEHYHVPLLVSPWSYSTYRGS